MQICKHCGWEINKNIVDGYPEWVDTTNEIICGRDGDGRNTMHEPSVTINGGVKPELEIYDTPSEFFIDASKYLYGENGLVACIDLLTQIMTKDQTNAMIRFLKEKITETGKPQ